MVVRSIGVFAASAVAAGILAGVGCGRDETAPAAPAADSAPRTDGRAVSEAESARAVADPAGTDTLAPSRPQRIVLISMDTVRADRVTGYGPHGVTPNVAEIAAGGALFRNFYAASSYTLPATMSMIAGLDVAEHTLWSETAVIAPSVVTLAQALRDAGYHTQGYHEGGYVDAEFGYDRGFDDYARRGQRAVVGESLWLILDWMRQAQAPYFLFLQTYAAHDPYGGLETYRREHPERGLPDDAALAALREQVPQNLGPPPEWLDDETRLLCSFLNQLVSDNSLRLACGYNLLSHNFVDSPHFETDRAALLRGYDERVRGIDRAIGSIRDLLVELGQWDDTLFVVTSDHGEAFFEHGLGRHDHVPFDEVLRAPLVISWPRGLGASTGKVVEGLAWHLDLAPTVLSLAGVAYPGRPRGVDLTPVMLGSSSIPADRAVFPGVLRTPNQGRAPLRRVAVQSGFKYIEGDERFGDAEGFLFDIASSPGETRNLREERPDRVERLRAAVRDYEATLEPQPAVTQDLGLPLTGLPGEQVPRHLMSREQEERLRALGYVD